MSNIAKSNTKKNIAKKLGIKEGTNIILTTKQANPAYSISEDPSSEQDLFNQIINLYTKLITHPKTKSKTLHPSSVSQKEPDFQVAEGHCEQCQSQAKTWKFKLTFEGKNKTRILCAICCNHFNHMLEMVEKEIELLKSLKALEKPSKEKKLVYSYKVQNYSHSERTSLGGKVQDERTFGKVHNEYNKTKNSDSKNAALLAEATKNTESKEQINKPATADTTSTIKSQKSKRESNIPQMTLMRIRNALQNNKQPK